MSDFDDMPMASKMATLNRKLDTLLTQEWRLDTHLARLQQLEVTVSAEAADQDMLLARVEHLEATNRATIKHVDAIYASLERLEKVLAKAEASQEPEWSKQWRKTLERLSDQRVDDVLGMISNQHLATGFLSESSMLAVRKIFEAYKRAGKVERA